MHMLRMWYVTSPRGAFVSMRCLRCCKSSHSNPPTLIKPACQRREWYAALTLISLKGTTSTTFSDESWDQSYDLTSDGAVEGCAKGGKMNGHSIVLDVRDEPWANRRGLQEMGMLP